MMVELEKAVASNNVLFGIKQTLKNANNINFAYVSSDSRDQIKSLLKMNKIKPVLLNFSKKELAIKFGLFECEVFGIKK